MARQNRYVVVNVLGFLLLALFAFILVGLAFVDSFRAGVAPAVLLLIALVGLVYAFGVEWRSVDKIEPGWLINLNSLRLFLAVFSGAIMTFFLSIRVGLGPVVAASVIAIVATLILPKYGVPIYCGAFAGMSCPTLFDTLPMMAFAGGMAGVIYVIAQKAFNGFGGKLGTIAFIGCVAPIIMRGRGFRPAGDAIGFEAGMLIIACSIIAAVITYDISVRLKHGPVMGSGVVGLLAGLIFPRMMPVHGQMLAVMAICASFAGMSAPARVRNEIFLTCAGFLTGMIFIFSDPFLGGAGGKLGTIAFASVIAVSGLYSIAYYLPQALRVIGGSAGQMLGIKPAPARIGRKKKDENREAFQAGQVNPGETD